MISFRSRTDSMASTLIVVGILLLLGTAYWFSLPLPNESIVSGNRSRQLKQAEDQVEQARKSNVAALAASVPYLWEEKPEDIGPKAQAVITSLVKTEKLKLIALRPQKPDDEQGLTLFPFGITVDGPYNSTMSLIRDFEKDDSRLAVSLVQLNSADAASDRVTGTINVVAYMRNATPAQNSPVSGGKVAQKS